MGSICNGFVRSRSYTVHIALISRSYRGHMTDLIHEWQHLVPKMARTDYIGSRTRPSRDHVPRKSRPKAEQMLPQMGQSKVKGNEWLNELKNERIINSLNINSLTHYEKRQYLTATHRWRSGWSRDGRGFKRKTRNPSCNSNSCLIANSFACE